MTTKTPRHEAKTISAARKQETDGFRFLFVVVSWCLGGASFGFGRDHDHQGTKALSQNYFGSQKARD
jgi:hypothetical protein